MEDAGKFDRELYLQPLRSLPAFDPELVESCRKRGEPMPLVFEWYKHVALLAIDLGATSETVPGHILRDRVHLGVLRGLLNRCARLMLSTIKLAHNRTGRETVALLARCILESAFTGQWLIRNSKEGSFERYVGDAVRTDLKLKELIDKNIAERGGAALVIEERMLKSIENVAMRADTSLGKAVDAKKLPDFASICRDLGYPNSMYIAIQRMGSHAVHGTWTDLLFHYIKQLDDGSFAMTDSVDSVPHSNQLSVPAHLVVETLRAHAIFILDGSPVLHRLLEHFDHVQDGIMFAQELGRESDFEPTEERDPSGP